MVDVFISYSRHNEAKVAQLAGMDAKLIRQAEARFDG